MSFTKHNNLEVPATGTQNWDSSVNENFEHLENGLTIKANAGETISLSEVTYIDANGEFQLAIADGSIANRYIGISITDINLGIDGYSRTSGHHLHAHWSWTPGNPIYLSDVTPGALTQSEPGESIMVGVAMATNEMTIRPWLEPGIEDTSVYLRTDNQRSSSGLTVTGTLAVTDIVPETGESTIHVQAGMTVTSNFNVMENLGVGTIDQFGAGIGVMALADASQIPTENPIGGGYFYSIGGSLIWRGSAGTTTLIANT